MRKKKASRLKLRQGKRVKKNRRYMVVGCVCAIVLLAFGTLAGPWSPISGSRRVKSIFFTPPPQQAPSPSKEYVYAGSRLIATEETNPLLAPGNVVASAISTAQINISWDASANAHHYVVERASQLGNFTTVNSNVSGTSYIDTVTNLNAYVYRVRAADAAGHLSSQSNIDLATAITFEDDPFPDPPVQTLIRAQHILQLRQAVNAVRQLVPGLGAASWEQDSSTLVGAPIKAIDIEELRANLDPALNALGLPAGGYTDSSLLGRPIKNTYIKELRARVK